MSEFSKLNGYDVKDKTARTEILNLENVKIHYVDNVNVMKENNSLKSGMVVRTLGYSSANDGGGEIYKITDTESQNEFQENLNNGLYATLIKKGIFNNKIIKIPTDYLTIEDAIKDYSYKNIDSNTEIIILIEENHKLTKGLKLTNGDYSHFRITSENDYVVQLDENFEGYNGTDELHPNTDGTNNSLFVGINCVFPIIDCLFDMENNFGDGIELYVSTGYINNGAGIINAGRYGIYAKDSSRVFAEGTIWSGSNSAGIRLQHTTTGTFNHSTLDGCCKTDSTLGSVYVSKQSLCQVRESTIENNTTSYGLLVRRSRVDIEATEISDCYGGIRAEGGSVVSASNCELDGITVQDAIMSINSIIIGGKSTNCSHLDFYVAYGGIILDAQESSNGNGTVLLSDCRNIRAFNVMNSSGMINIHNSTNIDYSYHVENVTNGKIVYYPSHAEMFLSYNKDIADITIGNSATINLAEDITIPNGYTVSYFNVDVTGRGNDNGGGATIATNKANFATLGNVLIKNTGVTTSSGDTTIKSLNVRIMAVLIPSN